ncbi:MAG TPA: ABC transporter permease [Nitrosopumilaceae archaeon]|nr:ABC transporter permease [Nitrosopumilaceae archaeon]
MFSTLITELGALTAFIKKDVRSRVIYKINLSLNFLNTLVAALTWSLLGQNAQLGSALAPYGGSFISYLLVGMAFNEYMMESLKAVQKSINPSELEEILAYPVRLRVFIFGNVLWGYTFHTINVLIYFSLGILVFGVTFNAVDPVGAIITLVLGIAVMFSFSLLASGILIVLKQGDIVQWLIGALSMLFAGVYFPIKLLPSQLQTISWILPQTYFFELMRLALKGHQLIKLQMNTITLDNAMLLAFGFAAIILLLLFGAAVSSSMGRKRNNKFFMSGVLVATIFATLLLTGIVSVSVHPLLLSLAVYALAMLPIGYIVFKKGLAVSKKRGTLSHE